MRAPPLWRTWSSASTGWMGFIFLTVVAVVGRGHGREGTKMILGVLLQNFHKFPDRTTCVRLMCTKRISQDNK